jgi:hypothetical protein
VSHFFRTRQTDAGQQVWDPVRKKYVALTPEEEIRHGMMAYLVEQCAYPLSLLSVEKQFKVQGQSRRYDIVVYNRATQPVILIECKQATVSIDQKTAEQAARYNLALQVPYLVLSNGRQHYIIQIDPSTNTFQWLSEFPKFEEL